VLRGAGGCQNTILGLSHIGAVVMLHTTLVWVLYLATNARNKDILLVHEEKIMYKNQTLLEVKMAKAETLPWFNFRIQMATCKGMCHFH